MKPNMLAQTVYFLNVKNLSEMKKIEFNRKFILFTWITVWKMDEDSTQIPKTQCTLQVALEGKKYYF